MTNSPALPTSKAALLALILGILALLTSVIVVGGLFGIVAIILAIIAFAKISKRQSRGIGFAITGLITGGVAFLIAVAVLISLAITLPALAKAREQARIARAESSLRYLGQCLNIYAAENDGYLPPHFAALFTSAMPPSTDVLLDYRSGTAPATLPSVFPTHDWHPYAATIDAHCDFIYACNATEYFPGGIKSFDLKYNDILAYTRKPTPRGYIVLYADFRTEIVPATIFFTTVKTLNDTRSADKYPLIPQPVEP